MLKNVFFRNFSRDTIAPSYHISNFEIVILDIARTAQYAPTLNEVLSKMVAQETFHSPNFQYELEGQKITVDIDIHGDEIHEIHRFESGIKVFFLQK